MTVASISTASALLGATEADPLAASNATRDQQFAKMLAETKEAKDMLAEITGGGAKGYWAWKMKQLREQITAQVMGEMGLTPEKLAAMSPEERLATLKKIEEAVEERLKLAMAEEMRRKQRTLLGFNSTAQSALAAQTFMQLGGAVG